jgi:hypothetical protein
LTLLLCAAPAAAEPPRRTFTDTFGGSVNNLGLQQSLEAAWSWPLSDSRNPLLADAHLAVGLTNQVSPAYVRLAGWAAWAPLSVIELRAGVEPVYYFGVVGSLIGFPSQRAAFDEDARRARRAQAVSGTGVRFFVAPTVRARLGRVVANGTLHLERWDVNGPDAFFYEPLRDTLLDSTRASTVWHTSAAVLWERDGHGGRKLLAGVHHELMRVRDARWNDMQRLGPLVVWTLGERRFGVAHPAVLASVYYYLEDPYKRHEPGASVGVRFGLR